MSEITVAVRDLVAFCHRRGDLDHRFSPSPTGLQGVEGHQRIYRRRPDSYQSEYPTQYQWQAGDLAFCLRGRADGYDASQGMVEEIKTCRVRASTIPEALSRMHLAQGRIYAAMIAESEDLSSLEVRLTWFNIDSGEENTLSQRYSRAELREFLDSALAQFSGWLQRIAGLREQRDSSLEGLDFPHGSFRAGQREIAELVYKCVDQGGQLMVEAPTGIGKTAAVLYPALKALATGKHDRVLFVTAKTVGRRTAQQTLEDFQAVGMRAGVLSLTSRESICFSPGKACHGEDCPFARGYYDRLGGALEEAVEWRRLHREDIEEIARRHNVCPYQLAMDLVAWVDVVIADLHYVYSLSGSLGADIRQDGRWSVLVDEAHNLPERATGMYGASLTKSGLMAARKPLAGPLRKALDKVNRQMLALQREDWADSGYDSRLEVPRTLTDSLRQFVSAVGEQLVEQPGYLQSQPQVMDLYFDILQFLRVEEHWGQEFRLLLTLGQGSQSLRLRLNCLDPSRLLAERQLRLHSVTAFSATLSPTHWASTRLGLAEHAVVNRQSSPFDPGQLEVVLATHIDTRYRNRSASLPDLARLLGQWRQSTPGNCIFYFPSYRYLRDCVELLDRQLFGGTWWVQEPELSERARSDMLELLEKRRDVSAFCILGGIFSEGIDLPGEQLSSVAIVGVGLPQVNRDTQAQRDWYQQRYGLGFEYAYLYPGMQKVDQALGRVIRGEQDRGSALLVDSRYGRQEYVSLLPSAWHYRQVASTPTDSAAE